MKNVILSAKDISKSFAHDGGQIHVILHLDLDIYDNDFTVIMGASGSGKSTLLYALSGMDKATGGSVMYNDLDLTKIKENDLAKLRHTDFGFIFQQMHLVNNLSLFENIVVPGYLNKDKSKEEIKEKALNLMELMNISHVKNHLPSQVSGGEQQRCAIARAVINEPKIIFADEPTGALNKNNTIEVLNLLTSLNNNGQSILMVTHDIRAALRANRVIYLEDGKVKGEIDLPPYKIEDEKSREIQLNSWLSSMKW